MPTYTGDTLKGYVLAHGGDPVALGSEDAQNAFVQAKLDIAAARPVANQAQLNWNTGKAFAIFNFASAIAVLILLGNPGVAVTVAGILYVLEIAFQLIRHKPKSKIAWMAFWNAVKAESIAMLITFFVAIGLAKGIVLIVPVIIWIYDGIIEWKHS